MTPAPATDLFIVGGGPAGLAAALAARRLGLEVTVADCSQPPVDKACGEGIMPDGVRAARSLGRARASSMALVCSDWVPPWIAAMASMAVRDTLLNTSCAASDQPEVWQWVRSDSERSSCGSNGFISLAHSRRAARSFATSMK